MWRLSRLLAHSKLLSVDLLWWQLMLWVAHISDWLWLWVPWELSHVETGELLLPSLY